jgi:hypothetical protein
MGALVFELPPGHPKMGRELSAMIFSPNYTGEKSKVTGT